MKAKLLLFCLLTILAVNLISCTPHRFNDYRGYYRERDYKEHYYTKRPPRDRD